MVENVGIASTETIFDFFPLYFLKDIRFQLFFLNVDRLGFNSMEVVNFEMILLYCRGKILRRGRRHILHS